MLELKDILSQTGTVLLDDALDGSGSPGSGGALIFQNPIRIISCSSPDDVPQCLRDVDDQVAAGFYVAGFLSYESAYVYGGKHLAELSRKDWSAELGHPVLWFGIYSGYSRISATQMDALSGETPSDLLPPALKTRVDRISFAKEISKIHSLIREGDLYQLNYTFRLDGEWADHPAVLFGLIRMRQPVAYGAYINLGNVQILSASPEKFFSRDGRAITVRPMKGTAPRGNTREVDAMYSRWLECDQKNRAENLMILDLFRSDLSRICEPASVKSAPVCTVEKYETVFQMVSGVTGELVTGAGYEQIFEALFPSGSITGAPKIRAMRRIAELEKDTRGIYCGAIGYIAPENRASFSVAIRTTTVYASKKRQLNKKKYNNQLVTGTGGGVVWDSTPNAEYDEAILKTQYLSRAGDTTALESLKIIESIYIDSNNDIGILPYIHKDNAFNISTHINRLISSAKALGYTADEGQIQSAISDALAAPCRIGPKKMRLLLGEGGELSISFTDLVESSFAEPRRIGIASAPVHSTNPFLYHKTTFRPDFERGEQEAKTRGLDDVVYINEKGQLTESTICNLFLRHGDVWRTPPIHCGLLPGIARAAELQSDRNPVETELTIDDLLTADEIVLTNAVRGRIRAVFIP